MDPNTLNLGPDPGFWPYLDLDPGLYIFKRKKKKNNCREKQFAFKRVYEKIMIIQIII